MKIEKNNGQNRKRSKGNAQKKSKENLYIQKES